MTMTIPEYIDINFYNVLFVRTYNEKNVKFCPCFCHTLKAPYSSE